MARKSKIETEIQDCQISYDEQTEMETATGSASPQVLRAAQFNHLGLREGISYSLDHNGFIDWVKLIDSKYIVANKTNFERRKMSVPEDLSTLEDKDKLVLLWGFKSVAQIRGYRSVRFNPIFVSESLVSLECQICWRGNCETGHDEVCFSGCGDAHPGNTFSFARKYLTAIAENRAFVRAVRNSLNIPILGQDEIGPDQEDSSDKSSSGSVGPHHLLKLKLKEKGKTFDSLKKRLLAEGQIDPSEWNTEEDIPVDKLLLILGKYFLDK